MPRFFCTYLNINYLSRGIALLHSLHAVVGDFMLLVVCFDETSLAACRALNDERLQSVSIDSVEQAVPALCELKSVRSAVEYFFSATPCVIDYALEFFSEAQLITYLDADLFFFASPEPIFAEIGDASVGIIEHRFSGRNEHLNKFGRFNVGWVSFRRDGDGLACLQWWKESCLEWCFDRLDGDRYADQKYLDQWPTRFNKVRVIAHQGANVAPWNMENLPLSKTAGQLEVGRWPLIFFHFQGLRQLTSKIFNSGVGRYGVALDASWRTLVFEPYVGALIDAGALLRDCAPHASAATTSRVPQPFSNRLVAVVYSSYNRARSALRLVRDAALFRALVRAHKSS